MSIRGQRWRRFAVKVDRHVDEYTVPQYGDFPDDQIQDWEINDCVREIKKYLARVGRNQREGQARLDMLKAAHYIQILHDLLEE